MADVDNQKSDKPEISSGEAAARSSGDAFRSEVWTEQASRVSSASDDATRVNSGSDQATRVNNGSDQTGRVNSSNGEGRGDALQTGKAIGNAQPSDKSSADAYPSDTARGNAYPSDHARGDAYPSDRARGDAYPSNHARGDAYPMPVMTLENGNAAETGDKNPGAKEGGEAAGTDKTSEAKDAAGDKKDTGEHPGDATPKSKYDPFFQNENLMQSMAQPFDAAQGDKPQEVVGGDSYTYDPDGVETYENAGGGRVVTNPDGTVHVGGDVISMTANKAGTEQTVIFADGSRVYLSNNRIRAVSSERNNQSTRYSTYREIYRSNYK